MQIKSSLLLILSVFTLLGCQVSDKEPPKIALEDFFRNPEKTYFKISPNGNYVSYTAPWKNRMNLFIQDINTDSVEQITFEDDRGIAGYL